MIPVTVLSKELSEGVCNLLEEKTKKIHFIGIGGIGMSGLAEYFLKEGHQVSGSDLFSSAVTDRLRNLGAKIYLGHSSDNIGEDIGLVVYTAAVSADNPELIKALKQNIKTLKRAEMLGEIVNDKYLIAVSGTHGKTTTAAMIAKLLVDAGFDPLVFVGGSVQFFEGGSSRFGEGKYAVVEADEYDRSFLTLKPDIAVITSVDEDHLDIYRNIDDIKAAFKQFICNSKEDSKIIYCGDDKNIESIVNSFSCEKISYGFKDKNFLKIPGYKVEKEYINFSIVNSNTSYEDIKLKLIGRHNVLNSAACFAVSKLIGIDFKKFRRSIKGFIPVERRLQLKYDKNGMKVYDDYAHHPVEIKASLEGLREIYENKRIISVFQPHLFSRTRDFYKEFANELSLADKIVLIDIYPAREEPIKNITSELIFNELIKLDADAGYIKDKQKALEYLIDSIKKNDVIVFQGAGDITNLCNSFLLKLSDKRI